MVDHVAPLCTVLRLVSIGKELPVSVMLCGHNRQLKAAAKRPGNVRPGMLRCCACREQVQAFLALIPCRRAVVGSEPRRGLL